MKKKIGLFLLGLFVTTMILSSCGSADQCAAYGEYKKYKVERR